MGQVVTTYWAYTDHEGKVAVVRRPGVATLEFCNGDGVWHPDPQLIDELNTNPTRFREISEDQAATLVDGGS